MGDLFGTHYCIFQVINFLLENGIKPCEADCKGHNVLHSLVAQAYFHPEREAYFVDKFTHLCGLLSEEQLRSMFEMENEHGMRPVEFAAQHGMSQFVMAMMNVPGIYLYKEEQHGIAQYKWYDVTEYESTEGRPACKNPLLLLTFADEKTSTSKSYYEMHCESLFRKWYDAKFKSNIPFIAALAFIRVAYIACFFLWDIDVGFYGHKYFNSNRTHIQNRRCKPDFAPVFPKSLAHSMRTFLAVYSLLVIAMDFWEINMYLRRNYWSLFFAVDGRKTVSVQFKVYRFSNTVFSMLILIELILQSVLSDDAVYFYETCRVICPVLAVWQILFFLQLLPSIGHFVITVQAILADMFNFIIIYIIFLIPFMHTFQRLVNINTNVGCFDEFTELFRVFYSTFTVMLNQIDFTSFDIRNRNILFMAHVVFTFMISIMMVNFFIALLTASVNRISRHRVIALHNQRSLVSFMMEGRCASLFKCIYIKLKRKYFHVENDRILIVTVNATFKHT